MPILSISELKSYTGLTDSDVVISETLEQIENEFQDRTSAMLVKITKTFDVLHFDKNSFFIPDENADFSSFKMWVNGTEKTSAEKAQIQTLKIGKIILPDDQKLEQGDIVKIEYKIGFSLVPREVKNAIFWKVKEVLKPISSVSAVTGEVSSKRIGDVSISYTTSADVSSSDIFEKIIKKYTR